MQSLVSVEPLPKQGCERLVMPGIRQRFSSLSGTPAEAGVRVAPKCMNRLDIRRLSGTPAEAGVREVSTRNMSSISEVSVEPLPKQGCELLNV